MRRLGLAALGLLLSTTLAQAATFNANWTVTNSSFSGTTGGSNVSSSSSGLNNQDAQLRWGIPATANGQSGYNWDGINGSILLTSDVEAEFIYGQFSHVNQPINSGSQITSTDLGFTLSLFGQDNSVLLDIQHNETLNTGPGCCNDIVSQLSNVVLDYLNDSGEVVGVITILPFIFSTVEGATTTVNFGGKLLFKETFEPPPPIPLPAPILLLLSGLAGLGLLGKMSKHRRNAAVPV